MTEIKGIEISDVFGIAKLFETISKGVGYIYEPIHKRRMAEATVQEIELLAPAIEKKSELITKYQEGEISIENEFNEKLLERTVNRLIHQEMIKQRNIDLIVKYAIIELSRIKKEDDISYEEVNTDWILRFMNSIEDISDTKMQELWGKILADEIKQPKTYNLRTLNILKNISKKEAKIFEKISQFILNSRGENFIYKSNILEEKYNIQHMDLLLLEECGLINSNYLQFEILLEKNKEEIVHNSSLILVISSENKKEKIHLLTYKVTQSGKELLKALNLKRNDDYALEVFNEIKEQQLKKSGKNFEFSAHLIKSFEEDGSIIFGETNLLD